MMAISKELRSQVENRDRRRCRYCTLSQHGQAGRFHIEHIVPRCLNGPTELPNLVMSCPNCNLHKAKRTVAPIPHGKTRALFRLLEQDWNMHFLLRADGNCVGLTDVGRTSLAALPMNDQESVMARASQIYMESVAPLQRKLSRSGAVWRGGGLSTATALRLVVLVQGNPVVDVLHGSYPRHALLHLAVTPIAAFHRVGGGRQK